MWNFLYWDVYLFVFVYFSLDKIEVYGFDFDFVIASYKPALQGLIYDLVKQIMVEDKRYPKEFLDFQYDPTFAIRGLHFDCNQGVLLKLDSTFNIHLETVFYGRQPLQPHQIYKRYPGLHVCCILVFKFQSFNYLLIFFFQLQKQYIQANIKHISDLFELSECTILADIVQFFADNDIKFDPSAVFRVCIINVYFY